MNRIVYFILLCALLLLAGCGHFGSKQGDTPLTDSLSIHQKAVELFKMGKYFAQCADIERRAVEQARAGEAPETAFEILSFMGYLQTRMGNYSEALDYMEEAADSLKAMPEGAVAAEDVVMFLGNLSNLYTRFHLFGEALEKNSQAIALSKASAPNLQPDLWRMRGVCFEQMNHLDSAEMCLSKSIRYAADIEEPQIRSNTLIYSSCCKAWFYIEHPEYDPDSIATALTVIESNIGKYRKHDDTNIFLAGRGYVLLGYYDKGLAMMEQGLADTRRTEDVETLEFSLRLLADSYAKAGDRRLIDIYEETTALHDTIMARRHDDVLLGKDFQYRVKEQKIEKENLSYKLAANRQRTALLIVICIMVIAGITVYFVRKTRRQRQHIADSRERIDQFISEKIFLNSKIEELNAMLQAKSKPAEEVAQLPTVLFDKNTEQKFREMFSELNPGFIENLRRDYPSLTSGNELLCMLIRLYKNNDEIAKTLGVTRESVAKSRYRLRTRFNLAKENDLNDFIQSR